MNSSERKRLLRSRIERGEYVPKTLLLKAAAAKPGNGLLHKTKSYRKDITQAYIEDAFQRPHLIHRCKAPQDAPRRAKPATPLPCKRTSGDLQMRVLPATTPPQAITTRDLRREYHFAPSPFSAQALTK